MTELNLQLLPIIDKHEKKANQARSNRKKGKRGEAIIGKILSTWWRSEESFLHSQSSGAGNRFGAAGDISTPLNFPFVIEVKNSEAWTLSNILTHFKSRTNKPNRKIQPNTFWSYWEQVLKATEDYNVKAKQNNRITKRPMLLFTKNYEEIFVMIPVLPFLDLNLKIPKNRISLNNEYISYYIFILEEFLELNPPETLGK